MTDRVLHEGPWISIRSEDLRIFLPVTSVSYVYATPDDEWFLVINGGDEQLPISYETAHSLIGELK